MAIRIVFHANEVGKKKFFCFENIAFQWLPFFFRQSNVKCVGFITTSYIMVCEEKGKYSSQPVMQVLIIPKLLASLKKNPVYTNSKVT